MYFSPKNICEQQIPPDLQGHPRSPGGTERASFTACLNVTGFPIPRGPSKSTPTILHFSTGTVNQIRFDPRSAQARNLNVFANEMASILAFWLRRRCSRARLAGRLLRQMFRGLATTTYRAEAGGKCEKSSALSGCGSKGFARS